MVLDHNCLKDRRDSYFNQLGNILKSSSSGTGCSSKAVQPFSMRAWCYYLHMSWAVFIATLDGRGSRANSWTMLARFI